MSGSWYQAGRRDGCKAASNALKAVADKLEDGRLPPMSAPAALRMMAAAVTTAAAIADAAGDKE